jgi:hypothetical protein
VHGSLFGGGDWVAPFFVSDAVLGVARSSEHS